MALGILSKKNREINKVVLLPLAEIHPNPNQPRSHFDPEALEELSASIEANGLLQPITVRRRAAGGYELIAGERRTIAFRSIGREQIPAIVEEFSDHQSAVLTLIENLQRKDLNYFEEALGIQRLMEQMNLNQQQISERLGKAQSTVSNKLRLLRYNPSLQRKMLENGLTERHARALLRIKETDRLDQAVDRVIEREYNVEQTEQFVEQILNKKESKERTRLFVIKDMKMFHNSIAKAVNLMNLAGIPIENQKKEDESYIEYTIRIPKSAVYKEKPPKGGGLGKRLGVV